MGPSPASHSNSRISGKSSPGVVSPRVVRKDPHPVPLNDLDPDLAEYPGHSPRPYRRGSPPPAAPVPVRLSIEEARPGNGPPGAGRAARVDAFLARMDTTAGTGQGGERRITGREFSRIHQNPVAQHSVERLPIENLVRPLPRTLDEPPDRWRASWSSAASLRLELASIFWRGRGCRLRSPSGEWDRPAGPRRLHVDDAGRRS